MANCKTILASSIESEICYVADGQYLELKDGSCITSRRMMYVFDARVTDRAHVLD
jgi:hypothetical protein